MRSAERATDPPQPDDVSDDFDAGMIVTDLAAWDAEVVG